MEELLITLKAIGENKSQERRFLAAIQGIDLEDDDENKGDVIELKGYTAEQEGFGIGMGLGYEIQGE
jgi:hypothetical protein